MTHYRVREFEIPGPKPPPQPKVELEEGEEPPPPPLPPPPLKRYRKVQFVKVGQPLDLCTHEHVSRTDADNCPVAKEAMEDAGYVGEVDDKALEAAKEVKDRDARVKAAKAKEPEKAAG